MTVFEIKKLNYDDPRDKKKMQSEVSKILKSGHNPYLDELEKAYNKITKKYGLEIKTIVFIRYPSEFVANIKTDEGYTSIQCSSQYDMLCKFILISKVEIKRMKLKSEKNETRNL